MCVYGRSGFTCRWTHVHIQVQVCKYMHILFVCTFTVVRVSQRPEWCLAMTEEDRKSGVNQDRGACRLHWGGSETYSLRPNQPRSVLRKPFYITDPTSNQPTNTGCLCALCVCGWLPGLLLNLADFGSNMNQFKQMGVILLLWDDSFKSNLVSSPLLYVVQQTSCCM